MCVVSLKVIKAFLDPFKMSLKLFFKAQQKDDPTSIIVQSEG